MSQHPRALYVLFFTEMWERFGFYTMIAIFTLYMKDSPSTGGLGLETAQAGNFYALFMGLVYFTPLLGGLIADRLTGERLAISIGAVFLGTGYFLLAIPPGARPGLGLFYLALLSIVIGNGLFKPNISTLVGKLYSADSPLRDAGFNIFYTGINLGAVAAPVAASFLRKRWSWQAAFGTAGLGMLVSLLIFLPFQGPRRGTPTSAARETEPAATPSEEAGFAGRLAALGILYLVSTMFWTLFFQNGFALTLWAKDCTARPAWITPEVFQVVNPLCVVLLSLAAAWFWGRMSARGRELATPDKILIGLAAAIIAALVMVAASLAGGDGCLAEAKGSQVSMGWLVLTYVTISLAEILVSPMGLSYCTKVAPRRLGGLVMGGWFASLAAGGYLSGFMGSRLWDHASHSTYFGILSGGIAAVAVLLLLVRNVLKRATAASQ